MMGSHQPARLVETLGDNRLRTRKRRHLLIASGVAATFMGLLFRTTAHADLTLPASLILTGAVSVATTGRIIEQPFTVPADTWQIDVDMRYAGTDETPTFDIGVRGPAGIRGWSTERRDHIHIDRLSASYGYLPGPLEAGEWHVMLGVPYVPAGAQGQYAFTVRVSDRPDAPRPVLRSSPGWYAGDLHAHSGHSDGYHADYFGRRVPVSMSELAAAASANHLDFLAVTDHNTVSHWIDVDRTQAETPDLLLLHAREITTYRGHFNAIGERRFTDFRLTAERPMRALLADAAADGSFVSINHPWVPNDEWCAGCGWSDRDAGTVGQAAGVEVLNGSSPPRPGSPGDWPGWRFWADQLNRGLHVVAVGGSDAHDPAGGRPAVGQPTTVVWASALSEDAITAGLKSGRVFVRTIFDGFVDLVATNGREIVPMGQTIGAGHLTLRAHVKGAAGQECVWFRRGQAVASTALSSGDQTVTLPVDAFTGDWFSVIVSREDLPSLVSNAVYVGGSLGARR